MFYGLTKENRWLEITPSDWQKNPSFLNLKTILQIEFSSQIISKYKAKTNDNQLEGAAKFQPLESINAHLSPSAKHMSLVHGICIHV